MTDGDSPASDSPPPDAVTTTAGGPQGDLPEAALRRLESTRFSSGLTVPDFAACLELGLQPVALVQGFCVMRWGWYGPGSGYMRGMIALRRGPQARRRLLGDLPLPARLRVGPSTGPGARTSSSPGSRRPGPRATGAPTAACSRRPGARAPTASSASWTGSRNVADTGTTEFHFLGTAVMVEDGPPPAGGVPWTTYLAGQRLTKSIEAGFMPVAVVAALASVRVWAYCMTEYLMEGSMGVGLPRGPQRGRAGEQGPHGGAPAGPQARAPAAGGRRAPRGRASRWRAASSPRATRSSTAPCGATGCAASRTSTRCPRPGPRCGSDERPSRRHPARTSTPAEMRKGAEAMAPAAPPSTARGITSDLSVDEALLLHAAGWEPLDLVCGVAVVSVPVGVWNWGGAGHRSARLGRPQRRRGPGGRPSSGPNAARCTGTASWGPGRGGACARTTSTWSWSARPCARCTARTPGRRRRAAMPFVSDLSARDFTLLLRAGWMPVGLAFGASFVYAPRRSARRRHAAVDTERRAHQLHRGHVLGPGVGHGAMQRSALRPGGRAWSRSRSPRARCASPATPSASPPGARRSAGGRIAPVRPARGRPAARRRRRHLRGREPAQRSDRGGRMRPTRDWEAWARTFESIDGPEEFAALFADGGRSATR